MTTITISPELAATAWTDEGFVACIPCRLFGVWRTNERFVSERELRRFPTSRYRLVRRARRKRTVRNINRYNRIRRIDLRGPTRAFRVTKLSCRVFFPSSVIKRPAVYVRPRFRHKTGPEFYLRLRGTVIALNRVMYYADSLAGNVKILSTGTTRGWKLKRNPREYVSLAGTKVARCSKR